MAVLSIHIQLGIDFVFEHHGCELVWVFDAESRPLRRFRFEEIFTLFGTILLDDPNDPSRIPFRGKVLSPACLERATAVHNTPLSAAMSQLGVRENDFWLYRREEFKDFVLSATTGPQRSFFEALSQGGTVSVELIWATFLLSSSTRRGGYEVVKVNRNAVARCAGNGSLLGPGGATSAEDTVWGLLGSARRVDCDCLGDYFHAELRQGGIWGDFLFKEWAQREIDEAGALRRINRKTRVHRRTIRQKVAV